MLMIRDLYLKMILPAIDEGLCGCIYTQLSDVEEEVNGIFTYDRKVCKVDPEAMHLISRTLFQMFSHLTDNPDTSTIE